MGYFDNTSVFWRTVFIWCSLGLSSCFAASPLAVFTANWCGPCQRFKRDLEANPAEMHEYGVEYVDIDKNKELAKELKVTTVPTFILYDNAGKEVKRVVGYGSLAELKKKLAAK